MRVRKEAIVCVSAVLVACSCSGGVKTTSAGGSGSNAAGFSSDAAGGAVSAAGGNASGGRSATGGNRSPGGASGSGGAAAGSSTAGAAATAGAPSAGRSGSTGGNAATAGAQSAAGMGGAGGGTPSCLIPTLDSSKPPKALTLSGNLGTHDPAVIAADGVYYLFATGNGIAAKTSTDMLSWKAAPDVFSNIPGWVSGQVSGVTNIWAPDVSFFGGVYHLYYAVSTFGSNKSCIGHATRASLSAGSWSDQGSVICSNVGTNDDWNAIDPNVIVDDAGTPWLDFGSFWSGIKLIKLDGSGKRADTQILSIAKHSSIEGPYIIYQCGYYYLFVSFGSCCNGAYDYNVRVGRSKSVMGPYTDKAGTSMMDGGGMLIVQGNSTWTAPGHNAVLVTPNATYNVYHALNASHANPTLRVAQLVLDADGWPVSGGP
jgi:arabinan endo-1,5-alpha-L-arabinosidase